MSGLLAEPCARFAFLGGGGGADPAQCCVCTDPGSDSSGSVYPSGGISPPLIAHHFKAVLVFIFAMWIVAIADSSPYICSPTNSLNTHIWAAI